MAYEEVDDGVWVYTCDTCGAQEEKVLMPGEDPWDLDSYPHGWTYGPDDDGTVVCARCDLAKVARGKLRLVSD
jgi:hypothetical protein